MTAPTRWGATPDEWSHFDLILGLGEDLLPVVSCPTAVISPDSKMRTLGKTPSLYNSKHHVVGIKDWPERRIGGRQIVAWSRESDYGICLQTRRVRAFDIDVPDVDKATAIADAIETFAGGMALRWRQGSGKRLLAFELPGNHSKRTLTVDGGVIEFLATGQQAVVIGEHFKSDGTPSGSRYEWRGGLPDEFRMLTGDQHESLMGMIEARFGLDGAEWSAGRDRIDRGADLEGVTDDVAIWLPENWTTYGLVDGKLYLLCPFKAEHTGDSGETETCWLVAGSGGVGRGHFKCLHAHCAGRSDTDFLDAVGYRASGFDVVDSPQQHADDYDYAPVGEVNGKAIELPYPGFERDRYGKIEATVGNVILACNSESAVRCRLAEDTFWDEMLICPEGDEAWRSFDDADAVELRRRLGSIGFKPVGRELMRDALIHVGKHNRFDSAQQWIEGLAPWDGVARAAGFMATHMGCEDTPYTRAVGLYAWSAHAARVMDPGCQADMAIIMTGPQGRLKSSAIAAIAPSRKFFATLSLKKIEDDDLARQMRGKLVAELAELRGLNSRDSEEIRAWITNRIEEWTPKYREKSTSFARRLILWGSANEHEILADATGERRWLPARVIASTDLEAIGRDRDQLWAEGLWLWRNGGVRWQDAERLARSEHGKFKIHDPWEDAIIRWLDEPLNVDDVAPRESGFRIEQLAPALGLDIARFGLGEARRIGRVLRGLGFDNPVQREGKDTVRLWVFTNSDDVTQ